MTVIRRCFVFGDIYRMLSGERFFHVDWKLFLVNSTDSNAALQRMIGAVKYYLNVAVTDNPEDARQFVQFCNEIYGSFLSDYQYIVKHHCDTKQINFNQCDARNCLIWYLNKKLLQQYFGNVEYLLSQQNDTGNLLFFRDLMNGMHCALGYKYDMMIGLKFAECEKVEVDENEMKQDGDGDCKLGHWN